MTNVQYLFPEWFYHEFGKHVTVNWFVKEITQNIYEYNDN
jgi:hypothetical protein